MSASRIDLVEIEARIQVVGDEGDIDVAHDLVTLTLPKLVAELRAAREVVLLAQQFVHVGVVEWDDLEAALDDYTEVAIKPEAGP